MGSAGVTRRKVDDALAAAAQGGLAALIDWVHPLETAAAQHRRLEESGSIVGKVILDPTMAVWNVSVLFGIVDAADAALRYVPFGGYSG